MVTADNLFEHLREHVTYDMSLNLSDTAETALMNVAEALANDPKNEHR